MTFEGTIVPTAETNKGQIIDRDKLPDDWPTHTVDAAFWEELGRTVASFGFLEEMLGKAIFALTGTKEFDPEGDPDAFEKWINTLEKALTDQLGQLIDSYAKALTDHDLTKGNDYSAIIKAMKDAKDIRNVLCHGSWGKADDKGRSVPKFVNRKMLVFETPIDVDFLKQTRMAVRDMICDVMDTVTSIGFQFPGSGSPGKEVWAVSQLPDIQA